MSYVLFAVGLFGLGWFVPHLIIEKVLKMGPRAHPEHPSLKGGPVGPL